MYWRVRRSTDQAWQTGLLALEGKLLEKRSDCLSRVALDVDPAEEIFFRVIGN